MVCRLTTEKCGVSCTRQKDLDIHGKPLWKRFHKLCDEVPCSICREACNNSIQGTRDRIAYEKGKNIYNKHNLRREAKNWACTAKRLAIS